MKIAAYIRESLVALHRSSVDLPGANALRKDAPTGKEIAERMELSRPIEAEMLHSLTEGRRTAGELVQRIYGVSKENPDYHTYYMKVFRAAKALQKQGYISTRLFGRDRPYKLTPYAAARMMEIEDGRQPPISRVELAAFGVTIALGIANMALALQSGNWLSGPDTIVPYSALLVLTGFCLSRLSLALRKVS